jgi:hypothetical protein
MPENAQHFSPETVAAIQAETRNFDWNLLSQPDYLALFKRLVTGFTNAAEAKELNIPSGLIENIACIHVLLMTGILQVTQGLTDEQMEKELAEMLIAMEEMDNEDYFGPLIK